MLSYINALQHCLQLLGCTDVNRERPTVFIFTFKQCCICRTSLYVTFCGIFSYYLKLEVIDFSKIHYLNCWQLKVMQPLYSPEGRNVAPFPSFIVTQFSVRPRRKPFLVAEIPILYSVLVGTVIDLIIGRLKSQSIVYIFIIFSNFYVEV